MKLCRICSCRSWGNRQKGHSEKNGEGASKIKNKRNKLAAAAGEPFVGIQRFGFHALRSTAPQTPPHLLAKSNAMAKNNTGEAAAAAGAEATATAAGFEGCFCVFSLVLPLAFIQLVLNLIKNTCQKVDHYVDFFCPPPAEEIAIKR